MADVFISYAREDRSRAEQIGQALASTGTETFWDTDIPPGQTWADYIEGKLAACKVLIVLWSENSTKSQWVREEARMGRDRGKLIPVMLDASPAPFGFGEVQAANLAHWTGDPNDTEWKRVRAAVEAGVARGGSAPPPPPAMTPPIMPPATPPQPQTFTSFQSSVATSPGQSPVDYIKKCFKLYANGNGRARRSEFWWFALFNFVLSCVAVFLDASMSGFNPYTSLPNSMVLSTVVWLGMLCPMIAVTARRFHDVGLNGWLVAVGYLLSIIWIGALFILVVGFIPGQPAENKYGPNPKAA